MGHPRPHRDSLPRPHSPRSPRCLDQCRAFDACDASTQSVQFSQTFYYFYISLSVLKMYWAVLTVDCQNSVCRNRVCRTSVCLPCLSAADCVYNIWLLWGFAPSTPTGALLLDTTGGLSSPALLCPPYLQTLPMLLL